jgi:hypothetical protein
MIKITDIVRQQVEEDIEATNALARGILNLSEYARTIKEKVTDLSKKDVSHQSIVVHSVVSRKTLEQKTT